MSMNRQSTALRTSKRLALMVASMEISGSNTCDILEDPIKIALKSMVTGA